MKWELHLHTAPTSPCGRVPAAEGIAAFAASGYGGVVVTDHYNDYVMDQLTGTDAEKVETWLAGYRAAREAGERWGLRVLFGLEAHSAEHPCNDFLIFGAEPNFVQENPRLYELPLPELQALCHRYGALLIQAHPFRSMCALAELSALDGVEVYNGHPSAANHMDKTYDIVKKNNLITTCGTDFHELKNAGKAAVLLPERVGSSKRFADMLFCDRQLKFIIPDDVKNDRSLPFWSDDRYISALQAEE